MRTPDQHEMPIHDIVLSWDFPVRIPMLQLDTDLVSNPEGLPIARYNVPINNNNYRTVELVVDRQAPHGGYIKEVYQWDPGDDSPSDLIATTLVPVRIQPVETADLLIPSPEHYNRDIEIWRANFVPFPRNNPTE